MSINRILNIQEWRTVATVSTPSTDFTTIYPKSDGFWYTTGSDGVEKQIAKSSTFKNGLVTTVLGTGSTIAYQVDLSLGIGLSFSSDSPGSTVNVLGLTALSLASINQPTSGYVLSAVSGGSFSWIPSASALSGTTNSIPKFTTNSNLGNSLVTDDGSTVFIGTKPNIVSSSFSVTGNANFGGLVYLNNNSKNYIQSSNGILMSSNDRLVANYDTGVVSGNYVSFFNATASLLDGFVQFGSASTKYFDLPQVTSVTVGTNSTSNVVTINSATYGALQIVDTNQGNNRFFVSDANGVGTWKLTGVFNGLTQSGLSYGIDYSIFGTTLTYSSGTINLPTTGVVAATYGASNSIPVFRVDSYGRVISATAVTSSTPSLSQVLNAGNTTSNTFTQLGGLYGSTYYEAGYLEFDGIDLGSGYPATVIQPGKVSISDQDGTFVNLLTASGPGGGNVYFQCKGGTVALIEDLVTATGPQGPQGATGTSGSQGPTGPQGATGSFQSVLTTQTGTSYQLQISDENTIIQFTNSSSVSVIIPTYSAVPFTTNSQIQILQSGTGTVSFTWSGITVSSYSNYTTVYGQWVAVALLNLSQDNWVILGNLK